MIDDQLIYFEAPFYNSYYSIPNESASPFREAQFDNSKPRFVVTKLRSATAPQGHLALLLVETSRHIQAKQFR